MAGETPLDQAQGHAHNRAAAYHAAYAGLGGLDGDRLREAAAAVAALAGGQRS